MSFDIAERQPDEILTAISVGFWISISVDA